jgi:hypothetical protein
MGLERAKGIEPSYAAWEAAVLPLNYARIAFYSQIILKRAISVVSFYSLNAQARICCVVGDTEKASRTRRDPQRGHFSWLSKRAIGKSRPLVHASVRRSSSPP